MTSTIDQSVIDRLTKLLGMLGSAHDGERGVTAAKADELVRSRGLTWSDVVARPQPASAPRRSSSKGWREPETIREKIDAALRYRGLLNAWEVSFLIDVKRFPPLTETTGVHRAHLPEGEGGGMNPKHLSTTEPHVPH